MARRPIETREDGFALVYVLWALLLLAAISTNLLFDAKAAKELAASHIARLRGRLILDAALNRAIASLLNQGDPLRLPLDGERKTGDVLGHRVTLSAESEAGKVDLNVAQPAVLVALLRHAGLRQEQAVEVASEIEAWRGDRSAGQRQQEYERYRAAGRTYVPRFAPFRSIGELRLVLGVNDQTLDAAKDLFTIWSGNSGVDLAVATDAMLEVLTASGDDLATRQLYARSQGHAAGADRGAAVGEVVTLRAELSMAGDCAKTLGGRADRWRSSSAISDLRMAMTTPTSCMTMIAGLQPRSRLKAIWIALIGMFVLALGPSTLKSGTVWPGPVLVAVGRQLFSSRALSRDGSVACSTCHVPSLGFSGDRPHAIGVTGEAERRRAPALLGVQAGAKLMWDGRANGLRAQLAMPLESTEMSVNWDGALRYLRTADIESIDGRRIDDVFSRDFVIDALYSYILWLSEAPSRFDRFYRSHDERALSQQEQLGFRLFVHKAHCSSCHLIEGQVARLTDDAFHNTGLGTATGDRGRAAVTLDGKDEAAFKTPSLRGVVLRPFLMHDGSMTSLREVVKRYNNPLAIGRDARLQPLYLSDAEIDAIVAFLGSLTPVLADTASVRLGGSPP